MRRALLWIAFACAPATAAVAACSSEETAVTREVDAGGDAEADVAPKEVDAGADARGTCAPQPLTGAPRFVPSRAWHADACTAAEVAEYVTSCLYSASEACAGYAKQHPKCFACAETDETAASWGPIVIFDNNSYFEENFAGCIANALGDRSADGCGAAQARFEECRRSACRGCTPILTQEDYDAFAACGAKKEIGKICAAELSAIKVKCAGHLDPPPDDPTVPCLGIGLDGEAYFRQYVGLFCMPESGDGGPDGGMDGGDGG